MTVKTPKTKKKCLRGRPSPVGTSAKHKETVRKCIVTNETLPMDGLIRFCVAPDGMLVPDLAHKLPGRGIWVTADKEIIKTACEKKLFAKYAKRAVKCPENICEQIEMLFVRRFQNLLGVAKKSGLVIAGFEKTAETLRKKQAVCLLEATDAAEDGKEKLSRLCDGIPVIQILTAEQAAQALGMATCVHAVLKSGGISDLFLAEARRFASYCKNEFSKV